jgi:hypothetical protein
MCSLQMAAACFPSGRAVGNASSETISLVIPRTRRESLYCRKQWQHVTIIGLNARSMFAVASGASISSGTLKENHLLLQQSCKGPDERFWRFYPRGVRQTVPCRQP